MLFHCLCVLVVQVNLFFYFIASFVGIYVHYMQLFWLSIVQLLIVKSANQISFYPLSSEYFRMLEQEMNWLPIISVVLNRSNRKKITMCAMSIWL